MVAVYIYSGANGYFVIDTLQYRGHDRGFICPQWARGSTPRGCARSALHYPIRLSFRGDLRTELGRRIGVGCGGSRVQPSITEANLVSIGYIPPFGSVPGSRADEAPTPAVTIPFWVRYALVPGYPTCSGRSYPDPDGYLTRSGNVCAVPR
jgi:hypothetical protein